MEQGAAPAPIGRIITLDIIRGVAVMGILAMNIVAFAMPMQAYTNPLAYGSETSADFAAFVFNFVFIDGKMRGLFSCLFGASMLLVIDRARVAGQSSARVTFNRQLWLLAFGMVHYYFIWFGDILIGYALIGMIAWLFRNRGPRRLAAIGIALILAQFLLFAGMAFLVSHLGASVSAGTADASMVALWTELTREIAAPSAEALGADLALHGGNWAGLVEHQFSEEPLTPYIFALFFGFETLGYMLLGMAGLKNGFLTADWAASQYRKTALVGMAVAVPAYLLLASVMWGTRFSVVSLVTASLTATVLFRPLMILAFAATIILLTRGGGWLVERIAAAGRAAFTNYIGTSILMTGIFYGWGFGFYGEVGRAQLWLFVLGAWAFMLAWSKPWLDRFAYGPLEWLWRTLARMQLQPMRRRALAAA